MEHKRVPEHSAPFSLLERDTEANMTALLSQEMCIDAQKGHATIGAVKILTVPAGTESPKVLVTAKCGLITIERI